MKTNSPLNSSLTVCPPVSCCRARGVRFLSWILVSAMILLVVPAATAITVLSNISNTANPSNLSVGADSPTDRFERSAQSFRTGTSNLTLNSVTLRLAASSGITGSSQPLVVYIYSSAVGSYFLNYNSGSPQITTAGVSAPNAQVGNALVAANDRPTAAGTYTYTYPGGLPLSANTTYWIVARTAETIGVYNWVWDNDSTAPTSTGGWSIDLTNYTAAIYETVSTNYPINAWQVYSGGPTLFQIDATAAAAPTVTVPGGTTTLTATTSGTAGASVNFNITGANLTGFPGNLTVTAPTNVQVSADNSTWGGTASIPYSTATLASTPVYVRLAGSGSVGTISGNVSITGGGLSAAVTKAVSGTLNPAPVAVTSLNTANATPTKAATVNWTLTFASAVTGLTASNFTLTGPAAAGLTVGTPSIASGGGLTWNIPVNTGATDGLLTLNLANATGLSAAISTSLPFTGQSYTIDKTPPNVLSVTRLTPSGQNTNATTVTFRVTYSETVALNTPEASHFQVIPVNGSNIVGTVTGVTGTTNTRDVTVNLTSGTGEFRLRVLD